jgi:hypothetical protein
MFVCLAVLAAAWMFSPPQTEAQGRKDDTHYIFAHKAIPTLLYTRKDALFKTFESNGQAFVEALWEDIARGAGLDNDERRKLLEFSKEKIRGATVYVIKMPPPSQIVEAFYVAVMEKDGAPRCFTLELMMREGGCASSTMLGEWPTDGQHRNLGCGPKPEKEAFLRAISWRLWRD